MEARRENGKVIIEFDEANLIAGVPHIPTHPALVVDDEKVWIDFFVSQICDYGPEGGFEDAPLLSKLIDEIAIHAAESASGLSFVEDVNSLPKQDSNDEHD